MSVWRPSFGDLVENPVASRDNPQRFGRFVRVVRRPRGRMNPGTWWELTDGEGEFWLTPPAICRQPCTGTTAQWCPVHGTCTCGVRPDGDPTLCDAGCPLHAPQSQHGEPS